MGQLGKKYSIACWFCSSYFVSLRTLSQTNENTSIKLMMFPVVAVTILQDHQWDFILNGTETYKYADTCTLNKDTSLSELI